jgi:hypothetical protein
MYELADAQYNGSVDGDTESLYVAWYCDEHNFVLNFFADVYSNRNWNEV